MHTYAPGFPVGYSNDLQGLLDFNNDHPELEGPWNSALWEAALATGGRDADCDAARAAATPPLQQTLNDLLSTYDVIIAPTNGPAWVTNDNPDEGDLNGDFSSFVGSSAAAAITGFADITVPAGTFENGPLPLGVTFIGGRWDEPQLIAMAYAYEQATMHRTPPQFLSTWSEGSALAATGTSHHVKAHLRREHMPR
jgi:amidase